ncbi:hypothetical protein BMAGB8_A2286, partial [Burkholderia mallei GB8 horse 4]
AEAHRRAQVSYRREYGRRDGEGTRTRIAARKTNGARVRGKPHDAG